MSRNAYQIYKCSHAYVCIYTETLNKKTAFEMSVFQQKLVSTQTGKHYQVKIDDLVRFFLLWQIPKKWLIGWKIHLDLFGSLTVTMEVWVKGCAFLLSDLLEKPLISITSVCKRNTVQRVLFCDMFGWLMPCAWQTYWVKQSLLVIFKNSLNQGLRASQESCGKWGSIAAK